MIAFVKGIVHSQRIDSVIVDNQGIGYLVYVPNPQSISLGQETMLYTYQHVREDAITDVYKRQASNWALMATAATTFNTSKAMVAIAAFLPSTRPALLPPRFPDPNSLTSV